MTATAYIENQPTTEFTQHRQVYISGFGCEAWVDEGIADDILLLWEHGIGTEWSCQGGDGYRYIALDTGSRHRIADVIRLLPWVAEASFGAVYESREAYDKRRNSK